MQLHVVGGFLGSGKTTAIIAAARQLIREGKKVGVVTNDRGSHLVDTAFFQNSNIYTVEIAQGCFRCSFDELEEKLAELEANEKPDVVFAESVGSCSDLVATVIKPLLDLETSRTPPTSFTVFTDSQLLLAYLQGIELPFSENITYIFEKQIEEAKLLILNKVDLLSSNELSEIKALVARAYPDKVIKLQNSTQAEDVVEWLQMLEKDSNRLPQKSLEIDYSNYGRGEWQMSWLDQEWQLQTTQLTLDAIMQTIVSSLVDHLSTQNIAIGHIKFFIKTPETQVKISLPTIVRVADKVEEIPGSTAQVLINARVEMPVAELKVLFRSIFLKISQLPGVTVRSTDGDSFHPESPTIPHRISD